MKKTTKVWVKAIRTDDIICNMCGNSCKCEFNFNGLLEVQVFGGFDSTHLCDARRYVFSLCEKCLSELFDHFLIKPETDESTETEPIL